MACSCSASLPDSSLTVGPACGDCGDEAPSRRDVVVIAALSGAGKSTVLHVFEDLRFVTADGMPPELLSDMVRLMRSSEKGASTLSGLALGLDQHRSGFAGDVITAMRTLSSEGCNPYLLFLEAESEVIMRRYATTRRPHPMEREGLGLSRAIEEERERLEEVREAADQIIDTSEYSIHDLRRVIQRQWTMESGPVRPLKIHLVSFGFKYGVPREADMVFDLRFLPNPYFVEALRPLSGQDKAVAGYVFAEPQARAFRKKFLDFMSFVLPQYDAEGRYRITVAIGCTGGKHRSVTLANALYRFLEPKGNYGVRIEHRDIGKDAITKAK